MNSGGITEAGIYYKCADEDFVEFIRTSIRLWDLRLQVRRSQALEQRYATDKVLTSYMIPGDIYMQVYHAVSCMAIDHVQFLLLYTRVLTNILAEEIKSGDDKIKRSYTAKEYSCIFADKNPDHV